MRFPRKFGASFRISSQIVRQTLFPLFTPKRCLFLLFYFDGNNSIFGALPHTLTASKELTNRFKFADIEQHIRNRLLNGSL